MFFSVSDVIVWLPAEKQVQAACELLNQSLYKRLSKKLLKESSERGYNEADSYPCQALFRDSYVKSVSCHVSQEIVNHYTHEAYAWIKLGVLVFKIDQIDIQNSRHYYILDIPQTDKNVNIYTARSN